MSVYSGNYHAVKAHPCKISTKVLLLACQQDRNEMKLYLPGSQRKSAAPVKQTVRRQKSPQV